MLLLEGDAAARWLALDTEAPSLRYLLTACANDALDVHEIAPLGRGRDDAGLIQRAGAERAA